MRLQINGTTKKPWRNKYGLPVVLNEHGRDMFSFYDGRFAFNEGGGPVNFSIGWHRNVEDAVSGKFTFGKRFFMFYIFVMGRSWSIGRAKEAT